MTRMAVTLPSRNATTLDSNEHTGVCAAVGEATKDGVLESSKYIVARTVVLADAPVDAESDGELKSTLVLGVCDLVVDGVSVAILGCWL